MVRGDAQAALDFGDALVPRSPRKAEGFERIIGVRRCKSLQIGNDLGFEALLLKLFQARVVPRLDLVEGPVGQLDGARRRVHAIQEDGAMGVENTVERIGRPLLEASDSEPLEVGHEVTGGVVESNADAQGSAHPLQIADMSGHAGEVGARAHADEIDPDGQEQLVGLARGDHGLKRGIE